MKVLVVVQARTGSSRLPGKVLLPVAGAPLLVRMLERVRAASTPSEVVVATTTDSADQPVRELARQAGVRCVSGHPTDLLDRHHQAALECGLSPDDLLVKIPSDCPLIDPVVIDRVIGVLLGPSQGSKALERSAGPQGSEGPQGPDRSEGSEESKEVEESKGAVGSWAPDGSNGPEGPVESNGSQGPEGPERYDFVSNLHPATYPDGNDVEVMPLAVLATAWREATRQHEREHTTPFIWDQPRRFRLANVVWEAGRDLSMTHRFTIDYPEDYAFVQAVYGALWTSGRPLFGLAEILDLLAARPDIYELNRRHAGVNWYRNHLGELATVGADQTRRPEETRA